VFSQSPDKVVVTGSRESTPLAQTPSAIGKVDETTIKDTKARQMEPRCQTLKIPAVWRFAALCRTRATQ
jgi:hypothetical protein